MSPRILPKHCKIILQLIPEALNTSLETAHGAFFVTFSSLSVLQGTENVLKTPKVVQKGARATPNCPDAVPKGTQGLQKRSHN